VTQVAIGGTLTALGVRPYISGHLNVAYVVALSLGDALLLVLLIVVLFAGLGAGIQLLWLLAIIGLVFWVAGFAFRSGEGSWYRR